MTIRIFVHGLEGSSQGNKSRFFRKRYPDMIIEDYTGSLEERMEKLRGMLADRKDLVLVGSSYGGLMAAMYACDNEPAIKKLILLAPALDLEAFRPYLNREIAVPVVLYHGRRDDVVPPGPVREIAARVFINLSHHCVDDDHPLSETFPSFDWDALLAD
ncbi:MAG: alpha/beta fold hydrolase [Syntrophobacterales bacterium]|nr:MAG: alpha/beta fold hydrolase [Syntrophobacterales bacterium]